MQNYTTGVEVEFSNFSPKQYTDGHIRNGLASNEDPFINAGHNPISATLTDISCFSMDELEPYPHAMMNSEIDLKSDPSIPFETPQPVPQNVILLVQYENLQSEFVSLLIPRQNWKQAMELTALEPIGLDSRSSTSNSTSDSASCTSSTGISVYSCESPSEIEAQFIMDKQNPLRKKSKHGRRVLKTNPRACKARERRDQQSSEIDRNRRDLNQLRTQAIAMIGQNTKYAMVPRLYRFLEGSSVVGDYLDNFPPGKLRKEIDERKTRQDLADAVLKLRRKSNARRNAQKQLNLVHKRIRDLEFAKNVFIENGQLRDLVYFFNHFVNPPSNVKLILDRCKDLDYD